MFGTINHFDDMNKVINIKNSKNYLNYSLKKIIFKKLRYYNKIPNFYFFFTLYEIFYF